jgi:prevent-host-death family protein
MITISIEEMQTGLLTYLREVEAGETLVITRAGRPVAELKPVSPTSNTDSSGEKGPKKRQLRPFGLAKGDFVESPDFDEPLPEEILRLFEGEEE